MFLPKSVRAKTTWQLLSVSVAALATILYAFSSFNDLEQTRSKSIYTMIQMDRAIQRLDAQKKDLEQANARNEELIRQLRAISDKNPGKARSQTQITTLAENVAVVQNQLSSLKAGVDSLNQAIGASPEKLVALPILKQPLEDFKTLSQRDVDSVRAEMARNYDLNKWLIGLILAAVLGTVINSFGQRSTRHSPSPRFE